MPVFSYAARRLTGQVVNGEATAASRQELGRILAGEGLVLVRARTPGGWLPAIGSFHVARRVRLSHLMTFLREFRSLIDARMPLAQALALLEERNDNRLLAAAVAATRRAVERGAALDVAMTEHPGVFDPLVRATVRAGTASGQLGPALGRLIGFLTLREQLERKIRRAMVYPVFLLALLALVLAVLMLFVLPRFAELYAEFGADLPTLTRVLMAAVDAAPVAVPAVLAVGVAGTVAVKSWLRAPGPRLWWDRVRLGLPVFGAVTRHTGLIQISFMMAMLLGAGMSLRDALSFTGESLSNADQARRLAAVTDAVTAGQSLSQALAASGLYPDLSRSLLSAGEAAADLDRMFNEVAGLHEQALEDRLSRILALIEPGMMLLVGVVLGTVIVAVYLPIFGISSVVR